MSARSFIADDLLRIAGVADGHGLTRDADKLRDISALVRRTPDSGFAAAAPPVAAPETEQPQRWEVTAVTDIFAAPFAREVTRHLNEGWELLAFTYGADEFASLLRRRVESAVPVAALDAKVAEQFAAVLEAHEPAEIGHFILSREASFRAALGIATESEASDA